MHLDMFNRISMFHCVFVRLSKAVSSRESAQLRLEWFNCLGELL